MEKQLIFFDQERYNRIIGSYETSITLIGQAIDIFNSLNLGSFRPEDLDNFILDPEGYVRSRVIENNDITALTKMGLSREKVIEMLAMPAQLNTLIEKVKQHERIFQQSKERNSLPVQNLKQLLTYYYFEENYSLVIKENVIQSCKQQCETYIETNRAKDIFSFASEIIDIHENYGIKFTTKAEHMRFLENLFTMKDDYLAININSILDEERRAK